MSFRRAISPYAEMVSCLTEMVTHERLLKVCFDYISANHDLPLNARAHTRENARAHPNVSFRCPLICISKLAFHLYK